MMNGKIDDSEIEALMTGDKRSVDRFLVTGIRELKRGLTGVTTEIATMSAVCEQRGLLCPGMHANLADPMDRAAHSVPLEDPEVIATRAAARVADVARVAKEEASKVADRQAVIIENTAKRAAEVASNLLIAAAEKAEAKTVAVAKKTAQELADDNSNFQLRTLWSVSNGLVTKLALPVIAVLVTLWLTGKL